MNANAHEYMKLYCSCLEEVKMRINAIESVLNRGTMGSDVFDIEFVGVQLRKTLEQIAFSSLVANKDAYSKVYDNYQKSWNVKYLMRDIERINPSFYPNPIRYSYQDTKTKIKNFENVEDGFLTKKDLIFLWEKCGAVLHARNPFLSGDYVINVKRPISEWVLKIKNLLSTHMIKLVNSDDLWVVIMSHPDDGRVHTLSASPRNNPL